MNDNNKWYLAAKPPPGSVEAPLSVDLLETTPVVKKVVTKRYPDGRTLYLLVIDDKLVEKSMTFGWEWTLKKLRNRKKKGQRLASNIGKKAVWN
jgi:hypothetical protein